MNLKTQNGKSFIFYILFIFRDRGREGEREGEKHQCVGETLVASHTPPAGDLACNTGMCPDPELNKQPFGSQASTQSTEPHQPGPNWKFLKENFCYPTLFVMYSMHIVKMCLHCYIRNITM